MIMNVTLTCIIVGLITGFLAIVTYDSWREWFREEGEYTASRVFSFISVISFAAAAIFGIAAVWVG